MAVYQHWQGLQALGIAGWLDSATYLCGTELILAT